jgi:hypothetical protein
VASGLASIQDGRPDRLSRLFEPAADGQGGAQAVVLRRKEFSLPQRLKTPRSCEVKSWAECSSLYTDTSRCPKPRPVVGGKSVRVLRCTQRHLAEAEPPHHIVAQRPSRRTSGLGDGIGHPITLSAGVLPVGT